MWEIAAMILFGTLIGAYLNFNLKYMTEKRGDDYVPGDWCLGVLHLHSDIFYKFWIDLLGKEEEEGEDISDFLDQQA